MAKFNLRISNKHLKIDKDNTTILIAAAATTVIVVFCLVAAQTLVKQMKYQNTVISMRSKAKKQLTDNIKNVAVLKTSYEALENSKESAIGTADKNSKIILDALPSKYDFPALATSLDGLINASGSSVVSITGVDNEAEAAQNSANPQPIEIPFSITSKGSFASAQTLVTNMQKSIRPFVITELSLTGSDTNLEAKVSAKTFYQPEKRFEVEQKIVAGPKGSATKTTVKKAATK